MKLEIGHSYVVDTGYIECEYGPTLTSGNKMMISSHAKREDEVLYGAVTQVKGIVMFSERQLHEGLLKEVEE